MNDFLGVFDDVMSTDTKRRYHGPAGLLDAWEALVEQCAEGYGFGLDELTNDLHVRTLIERLLTDPRVADDPVRAEFAERVNDVDSRFRALLRPDVSIGSPTGPWWLRGVLRDADEDYIDDLRSQYGIGD